MGSNKNWNLDFYFLDDKEDKEDKCLPAVFLPLGEWFYNDAVKRGGGVFSDLFPPMSLSQKTEEDNTFANGFIEPLVTKTKLIEKFIDLDSSQRIGILQRYDNEFKRMIGIVCFLYLTPIFILIVTPILPWLINKLQSEISEIGFPFLTVSPSLPFVFIVNFIINLFLTLFQGLIFIFFISIAAIIVLKIIKSIINRNFARILCITNALFIIIELDRPEILINPKKRKKLVHQINLLAKITLFLPQYYKHTGQASLDWLEEHFKNMAFHILERGRWIISPTELTLGDLRGDFYELAGMYITGRYGEFKWPSMYSRNKSQSTWRTQLVIIVTQLLTVAIPVILLIPSIYKNIPILGVQPQFVSWISSIPQIYLLTLLLASVDSIFKLGISKDFIDLLKGIKVN